MSAEFPLLAIFACRVLAIPATQVEPERLFSCTGNIVTKSRNRLARSSLELLVLLRHWWKIVEEWEASNVTAMGGVGGSAKVLGWRGASLLALSPAESCGRQGELCASAPSPQFKGSFFLLGGGLLSCEFDEARERQGGFLLLFPTKPPTWRFLLPAYLKSAI